MTMTTVEFDTELLENPALSYRARGVLMMLLPLPPGTQLNSTKLSKQASEGRDAVIHALAELEQVGFLRRRGKAFIWDGNPTRWLTRPE